MYCLLLCCVNRKLNYRKRNINFKIICGQFIWVFVFVLSYKLYYLLSHKQFGSIKNPTCCMNFRLPLKTWIISSIVLDKATRRTQFSVQMSRCMNFEAFLLTYVVCVHINEKKSRIIS